MKLKPNVDFRTPICIAYKYTGIDRYGMQTIYGTTGLLPATTLSLFRRKMASSTVESFGSIEECELTAVTRGLAFLNLLNECQCIGENPAVLEFIAKHNPDAVSRA